MWRAFFFAVGTMMVIVGVECLMIDSATLASDRTKTMQVDNGWFQEPKTITVADKQTVKPPEWIPWSLIASGSVVILYAMSLPQRWGNKGE